MQSVLILNRSRRSLQVYRDWLGPDVDIRMVSDAQFADGKTDPAVTVVENYDTSGLVELAAIDAYRQRPYDQLIALAEEDITRAGRLRQLLTLPGQDYISAVAFRDEVRMKEFWVAARVPTTPFAPLVEASDLLAFVADHGLPVVVKPRSDTGSRGVAVLDTEERVRAWIAGSWKLGLVGSSPWMVEAFVDGQMITVDGLFNRGTIEIGWPSYISNMLDYRDQKPTYCVQMDFDDPELERCRAVVLRCLQALPHPDLIVFHAELWRTAGGGLLMNEIASRQGGGGTGAAIEAAFGVSMIERFVRGSVFPAALAASPPPARPARAAGWVVVPPKVGVVARSTSARSWDHSDWTFDLSISVEEGQETRGAPSSGTSAASCTMIGRNRAEVQQRLEEFVLWVGNAIDYVDSAETESEIA